MAAAQRSIGNQAVLRLLDRAAPPPPSRGVVQRKRPPLVSSRVYWYDSDDPSQELFDSEQECRSNADLMQGVLGGGLTGRGIPELTALSLGGFGGPGGGIVKTWEPPSPTVPSPGGRGSEPALLPIFDIRTAGKNPAPRAPKEDSGALERAYLAAHDDDPRLARFVLTVCDGQVLKADQVMALLSGDLRTVPGALLVLRLLDSLQINPLIVEDIVGYGAATAQTLAALNDGALITNIVTLKLTAPALGALLGYGPGNVSALLAALGPDRSAPCSASTCSQSRSPRWSRSAAPR